MGKGDKKSKRGKIILGSYGVRRPRKKIVKTPANPVPAASEPVESVNVKGRERHPEPVKEKTTRPAKEKAEKTENKPEKTEKETKAAKATTPKKEKQG